MALTDSFVSSLTQGVTSKLSSTVSNSLPSGVASLLDPSKARLAVAGLADKLVGRSDVSTKNGNAAKKPADATFLGSNQSSETVTDWRVKLSLAPGAVTLYNLNTNTLLDPIYKTNGVIFPITPVIQLTHIAKYSPGSLTHSNYAMQFYEGSEVGSININGEFTVQNIEEGQYLMAVIYFLRAATKMYWGGQDIDAGTPPPMLYLTGYGKHYFPNVPCVLTSFMHTLPDDKDYVEVPTVGGTGVTRLPTQSSIQIVLQPIYSRTSVSKFDLESYANGSMITGGFL